MGKIWFLGNKIMKKTKISVFKVVLICVLIGFVLGYFVTLSTY